MPEATTTTVDHAILLRQVGNGFYLTDRGIVLLFGMWTIMAIIVICAGMNRSK